MKKTERQAPTHGGARQGAGRKPGSGQFGEATKVMRIPESKVAAVKAWLQVNKAIEPDWSNQSVQVAVPANDAQLIELPWFGHKVVAGFPSPAEDYIEARIDLNDQLIRNKEATFLLTVQGNSMQDAGIKEGDILVVDRSVTPVDGKIVIAALDGELTVKRLAMRSDGVWLLPENEQYPPIKVKEENDMLIWGVVTATISQF